MQRPNGAENDACASIERAFPEQLFPAARNAVLLRGCIIDLPERRLG
jgi:hypothetical protein